MDPDSVVSATEGDLRGILDRMDDGVFAVDTDWCITYANAQARAFVRAAMPVEGPDETLEGRNLWEAVPDARDTVFSERGHEAMATQESVAFEARYDPHDTWFDVRAFPSASGLTIYLRDITAQKRSQRDRQTSLVALQRLYTISSDRDLAFDEKLDAILEVGCEYLGVPNGFLTRVERDTQYIEAAVATHPELQPGESCPLDEAYCRRTIEGDQLLTVVNAAEEGWDDDPAYQRFQLGTYIGGRVRVDDSLYGTLCFADTESRERPFTETQRTVVELLTRWVSYELERLGAEAELKRERDRLDEFVGVVSHDLRNPLNVATGRAELLATEVDSDHLPPLQNALSRMDELLDDLLTLAREGSTVERMEPFRLSAAAEAAWRTIDTGEATLVVDLADERVVGDESRVVELFENLFRNAVEHGGPGVTVTVGSLAEDAGFYVADDGPGIPPDERAAVFEAGYTTSGDGTGFGLPIVGRIVAAHEWEIDVTESETGGARFEVSGVQRPD